MIKYIREYGRDWNAKVPRSDIAWLVNSMHVSRPDDEVRLDVVRRCNPDWDARIITAAGDYAVLHHHHNRDVYTRVMRGSP